MGSSTNQVLSALPEFARLLRERIERRALITEDSIRFTFFAALLAAGTKPHEVVLEYPHESIERAKIDTVLLGNDGEPFVAIEFKYDREIPSGGNQPRTKRAGAVLNDMARLSRLSARCMRYFIHVTDREMANYWRNESNRLAELFALRPGQSLSMTARELENMPQTFRSELKGWSGNLTLNCAWREELPNSNSLRIYELTQ